MWKENYNDCLLYIDSYWNKIILKPKRFTVGRKIIRKVSLRHIQVNYHILEVPYTTLVPNNTKYRYIFYWDSYFMFQGLKGTKNEWVIPEMVENFIYIFKKYQVIPNFSHPEALGRSQAPFLTSMIFDAYDVLKRDKRVSQRMKRLLMTNTKWLKSRMEIAKKEYIEVWESKVDVDHLHYNHKPPDYNLNRYGDRDVGYGHNAEKESGWDFTSRFYERCDQFLPVDLNCYLYKYENDFAYAAKILGEPSEEAFWRQRAETRKADINKYLWNQEKGFFYDYNYIYKKQSNFLSLAGFVPMWVGLATVEQARIMVEKITTFRTPIGLTITDKNSLAPQLDISSFNEDYRITLEQILKPKQWDYPNVWPPLHYMVVIGLLRYGYNKLAYDLMRDFVEANANAYRKYGAMLEKMDGLTGDMPPTYWYPTQVGFGWTNAIFYRYIHLLTDIDNNVDIYEKPLPPTYPYSLRNT